MTIALKEIRQGQAFAHVARRINVALVVFLLFYLVIGLLQPNYFEPAGAMNFLRRAAPLAILAAGQLFVLVSGGFDLSVGSLVTLTVVGGSMLTANDPGNTWWAIAVLYAIGLCRSHQWRGGRLSPHAIDHRDARDFALGQRRFDDVVRGLARGYLPDNFRMFGRFVFHDVPVVKIFPVAIAVLVPVCALARWGLHRTVFGRRVFAIGDNARAAQLAGVEVGSVRIAVFVISALAAVQPVSCSAASAASRWTWGSASSCRQSPPASSAVCSSWAAEAHWSERLRAHSL